MDQIYFRTGKLRSWLLSGEPHTSEMIEKAINEIENLVYNIPTEIEAQHDAEDRDVIYTSRNGKKYIVSPLSHGFVEMMQSAPADVKMKIIRLTEDEIEQEIFNKKQYLIKWIKDLLRKKWYWRATGDKAFFDPEFMPLQLSIPKIKYRLDKCLFTISELEQIIEFFVGDRSEIYIKE